VILLLAADYDDARRWDDAAQLDDEAILITSAGDVQACTERIEPGARIMRTDLWPHDERIISALKSLAVRVPLADPTGLLGPILHSPDARTREPFGTKPIGAIITGTNARGKRPGPKWDRKLGAM
jgi:hypothetical protein